MVRAIAQESGDDTVASTAGTAPADGAPLVEDDGQSFAHEESNGAGRPSVRSPPVLILVADEEEEVGEFSRLPLPANDPFELEATTSIPDAGEEPPFDPPDLEELLGAGQDDLIAEEGEAEACAAGEILLNIEVDEAEPPFDPLELEELAPANLSAPVAHPSAPQLIHPSAETGRGGPLGPPRDPVPDSAREQIAPAIRIHLSWDRPDGAAFFKRVAADPRLARTEITIARGGLDGAAIQCAASEPPDLLVVDTTLRGAAMLASLDRLLEAAGDASRILILGAVNDVTLLREMAQRGVDDYLIWPAKPEDVVGSACAMFAGANKARVIAVFGARGGIGASTIAQNIAWSIAERQGARTTLVDLDLSFGSAAFNFKLEPPRNLAAVLSEGAINDVALEQIATARTKRLQVLAAPADPQWPADLASDTAQALVAAARRLSSYIVLDLPHAWEPWVKQALLGADQIVLVTSPDIAGLRNADNIAKRIKDEHKIDPVVVLSMVGVPKRPEVPLKEFAEALGLEPACALTFEPNLFGAAALTGQPIGEIAPGSLAAKLIDRLATSLTGREPVGPEQMHRSSPKASAGQLAPIRTVADPFETALVNPIALMAPEDVPDPVSDLPPLILFDPAPVSPDYIACARAAALTNLHQIESLRRAPRQGVTLGPFASAAAGFVVTALGAGAYLYMQLQAGPAPAAAAAEVQAAPQPVVRLAAQDPAAAYAEALQLIEQGSLEEAALRLQRLADAGLAIAQYRLAKMYENGEGVAADLMRARQWTERAANGGNPDAMHDLGVYYARGEGVPRDESAAARWFQQAAEAGFVDSQFNLAVLYEEGRGVQADPAEALFWFMRAARAGDAAASERAARLESELTPFELEQIEDRLASFAPAQPAAPASAARADDAETMRVPASPEG